MKNIVVLGSTGSIGEQALEVARSGGYKVLGIAAGSNIEKLEAQAREFKVKAVGVFDEDKAKILADRLSDTDTEVFGGEEGVCRVAGIKADITLNSIVGIAGLKPTFAAIEAGNDIALANKETLVTAGELVNKAIREKGLRLLPVDSEHSAIFQSLQGSPEKSLSKIILTASGGPFFGKTKEELLDVTAKDALKHPNWTMGAKITIDSATLMRLPIQYAFTYPERGELCCERLSLSKIGTLTFACPDFETFPCLKLCIDAIKAGGLKPAAANGANEEAVALFLDGKIKFLDIPRLVKAATDAETRTSAYTLDEVFDADKKARALVRELA